jgi:hypothetical protein
MTSHTGQDGKHLRRVGSFSAGLLLLICASCATTAPDGKFSMFEGAYPQKPADYKVQVFEAEPPSNPFIEISRLDVHIEKAFFAEPDIKEAMPELIRQARLSGADAIIKVQQRKSVLNETKTLHVTATGIKYKTLQ